MTKIDSLYNIGRYYRHGIVTRREALSGIRDVLGDITDEVGAKILTVSMRGSMHEIAQLVMYYALVPIFGYVNITTSTSEIANCCIAYRGDTFAVLQIEYDNFTVIRTRDDAFIGRFASVSEAADAIICFR